MGNGGSAADAQHLAAELVGRFKKNRPSLAAIALSTNTSIITAIGNDFGFENIFARQIESMANSNDVIVGIFHGGMTGRYQYGRVGCSDRRREGYGHQLPVGHIQAT